MEKRPGRGWLPLWGTHSSWPPWGRSPLTISLRGGRRGQGPASPDSCPSWREQECGIYRPNGCLGIWLLGEGAEDLWLKVTYKSRCSRHGCPMDTLTAVTSGPRSPSKLCVSCPSGEASPCLYGLHHIPVLKLVGLVTTHEMSSRLASTTADKCCFPAVCSAG